jgi:hypothetical protein
MGVHKSEGKMTETKKSPEQMQLCFDESVSLEAAQPRASISNVVTVDFGKIKAAALSAKTAEISQQAEKSIIGQVLDRARRLNW